MSAAIPVAARKPDFRAAASFLNIVFKGQERGALVLFCKPGNVSSFADLERDGWQRDAAKTAMQLSGRLNVYFAIGVQGVPPGIGRGNEAGVVALPGLWADVDVLGPNHVSLKLPPTMDDAWEIIRSVPFKPTVIVYTGGGIQPYWLFREPWELEGDNDRSKVKSLSKAFQKYLQNIALAYGWTIDSTADLCRLLRLPGTYNRKQAEPALVRFEVIEDGRRYNPSDFEEFLDIEADTLKAHVKRELPAKPTAEIAKILGGCAWMRHCKEDAASLPEPEWYRMLSIVARVKEGTRIAHDLSRPHPRYTEQETTEKLKQAIGASGPATCTFIAADLGQAKYCHDCEYRGKIKSPVVLGLIRKKCVSADKPRPNLVAPVAGHVDLLGSNFADGDLGNAQRLIAMHGLDLRYNHDLSKWLVWDGRRWCIDGAEQARKLAQDTMLELVRQSMHTADKDLLSFATRSLRSPQITFALREAQPHIFVPTAELDRDPWLLNFRNGTLDLRTGDMHAFDRDDFITKMVHHDYRPDAECPTFLRFLGRILGVGPNDSIDHPDRLTTYLQKVFGYALTGTTREKVVFIFHGSGNNGKSTLLSTFLNILEEYSVLLQIDTLMMRQESNNTQADLADLRGARFVMTSETEKGQRLAEGKLKRITQGMGKIKAVRKYENPIEFPETHKLFVDANHKPVVRGSDNAMWNRLHPVPFSITIPSEEIDPEMPAKLLAEADGILAWAVAGTLRWQGEGLGKPPEVQEERARWRAESNPLREFIEDCCVVLPSLTVRTADLWQAYGRWAGENGERRLLNRQEFAECLETLGCKPVMRKFGRPNSERGRMGIGLRTAAEPK